MRLEFSVSTVIGVSQERLYNAWLDSDEHTNMTGGEARVSSELGGSFSAWDGYIWGKNLVLEPNRRIIQSWRTSDFSEDDPDSQIEIQFESIPKGTKITLVHTNLPPDGASYQQGWVENYFNPMRAYFEG